MNIGEVRHTVGGVGAQLVGRGNELTAIDRALDRVGAGRPVVLHIPGEPGIGKSRLLAELGRRADDRGYLVLEGAAAEFEAAVPFAMFVAALDDYLAATASRLRDDLEPAVLGRLAAVFPALEAGTPAGQPRDTERFRIHRAVRQLLGRLARDSPLVLILDDAHWADPASAELAAHLLNHALPDRVLMALADRPPQLPDRLRSTLDRAAADGRAETLWPRRLNRDEAADVVPAADAASVDRLFRESGGNPFYLLELARAQGSTGVPAGAGGVTAAGVPTAVSAAIDGEIRSLPARALALAHGAAVAGEPFDVDLAARAADLPAAEALGLLDLLVADGLIRPTDVPRRFAFRHPLVRRSVYQSAGPGWRITAHRRLVELLRSRGAPPEELAHHLLAAAEPGDTEAAILLTAAGHAVAHTAPLLAAGHFRGALRLLPADSPARPGLLVALAGALTSGGRFAEAYQASVDALTGAKDPAGHAELTARCARLEYILGRHNAADERLLRALDELPDRRSAPAARLLIELISPPWSTGWEVVREHVTEAAELGRRLDDRTVGASALALLAFGDLGSSADCHELLRQATELADTSADDDFTGPLDAFYHLARAGDTLERFEQAIRHADRGLALARSRGDGRWTVPTLTWKASALCSLGRLGEAGETAEEAIDTARLSGHDTLVSWALQCRTLTATAQGDLGLALAAGTESRAINRQFGTALIAASDAWLYGEALLEAGQPDRLVELVLDAAGGPDCELLPWAYRYRAWQLLARADVRRGRYDDAAGWLDRLDAATPGTLWLPTADGDRARAELLLAQDRPDAAAEAALRAVDAADQVRAHLDAARARLLAGQAFAATGERARAIELLDRARTELDSFGARRYHDQAVQLLRGLGVRIGRGGRRGAAGPGLDALSDREREIAELVAEGRTNKEIGAALYLSVRTVERHLSHIFDKLGVSSRTQLGALVGSGPD